MATNSVPHIDQLSTFLKKMVANAVMNSGQSMLPYVGKDDGQSSICTQNSNFSRRAVKGQQIKRDSHMKTLSNKPASSPFSNAFFDETDETSQPNKSVNVDQSRLLSFDDVFLEQDKPKPKKDTNSIDLSYNFDDEEQEATSTVWTRQRIKGLERTIANLAPANSSASDGKISLTKQMLSHAQVIAQVELKFIIIKTSCGVLCAVDQHAADERVSLEKLESAMCNPNLHDVPIELTKRTVRVSDILKATKVVPSKRLALSQKDISTVKHHWSLLQKWKFTLEETEDNTTLLLTGLPSVCDRVAEVSDLLAYVRELGHLSGGEIKPPFVKTVLASNACRYAIMFGDFLTTEKCVELIDSLSKCELPFQCAHGRPSIIPLVDMNKDSANYQTTSVVGGVEKDNVKCLEGKSIRFGPNRIIRK